MKLGKPKLAPAWLASLAERLKKDFGHCVKGTCEKCADYQKQRKKKVDAFCMSCVACRAGLALSILEDGYGVGDRKVLR